MERIREGWYERNEIQKVTLDWVKTNCILTEREEQLLKIIYDRKLVRRDHLEIISESYRNAGLNKTILLNRAIKKMYKMMCLDKIHEVQEFGKGSKPCIVSIDKAGSLLLNVPHKKRILQNKTTYKGKDYIIRNLPSNYRHINGINQLEVKTILFCEEQGFEIVKWELEEPRHFTSNAENIKLIPDVLMIIRIRGKPFVAFIEFDTGSEGLRQKEPVIIKDKIIKYKKYKSSNLWTNEDWQKDMNAPMYPIVLFVTQDEKRVQFFNDKSKELRVQGLGMYYERYTDVLKGITTLIK